MAANTLAASTAAMTGLRMFPPCRSAAADTPAGPPWLRRGYRDAPLRPVVAEEIPGNGAARTARRDRVGAHPRGDLLQAGPLLVADGAIAYDPDADEEGFHAAAHQFDPDPTEGRHPRAALGLAAGRIVAVACDGRSRHDAGLTLLELARLMVALGCEHALNLDGGGSTALISGGRLQNLPRCDFEVPEPGGRPLATALTFEPV